MSIIFTCKDTVKVLLFLWSALFLSNKKSITGYNSRPVLQTAYVISRSFYILRQLDVIIPLKMDLNLCSYKLFSRISRCQR